MEKVSEEEEGATRAHGSEWRELKKGELSRGEDSGRGSKTVC